MPAPLVARRPADVDAIAGMLQTTGAMVRKMPASWDAAKDMIVIGGGHGERIGRGLPGKGIVLDRPLKELGITKPIAGVFDRPMVERMIEACGGRERLAMSIVGALTAMKLGYHDAAALAPMIAGSITDFDGIVNATGVGKDESMLYNIAKTGFNTAQNQWSVLFANNTGFPGGFTFTAALGASAPGKTTGSSLATGFTNPSGGDKSYLLSIGFHITGTTTLQVIMLADLLYECGGISATTATLQTLGTAALTRYTSGIGVMAAMTPTTQFSNTTVAITVLYTNTTPTGSRSGTINHLNTSNYGAVDRIIPASVPFMTLASGDVGVTSVQSVQFASGLVAGVGALFLYKPMLMMPGLSADVYAERDSATALSGLTEMAQTSGNALGCPVLMGTLGGTSASTTMSMNIFMRLIRG